MVTLLINFTLVSLLRYRSIKSRTSLDFVSSRKLVVSCFSQPFIASQYQFAFTNLFTFLTFFTLPSLISWIFHFVYKVMRNFVKIKGHWFATLSHQGDWSYLMSEAFSFISEANITHFVCKMKGQCCTHRLRCADWLKNQLLHNVVVLRCLSID